MASTSTNGKGRPPLPPRPSSATSHPSDPPPPYSSINPADTPSHGPWSRQDQRTSSTQSLAPSESNEQGSRRRLLLIYIHGFMGNETSFRSFPAHVHYLLTVLLQDSHVVHTKIYPRYRSKRNISFARDDFSKWLEPHEDASTDVVLLGHSMGGLVSAEVVLMPAPPPANRPLKHRILGTVNFDVPFLGMHPGVVKSGLASIFIGGEAPGDKWLAEEEGLDVGSPLSETISPVSSISGRSDTLWRPDRPDPNLNPSFANDVALPMRKGWQNALHFMNKHSDHLIKATKQLVTSHLEFGGAMANYPELKSRYGKIRALEEESESMRNSVAKSEPAPPRVRFVNYYTASTGRVKKSRSRSPGEGLSSSANASQTSLSPSMAENTARGRSQAQVAAAQPTSMISRSQSPQISLQEHSDEGVVEKVPDIPDSGDEDWEQAAETLAVDGDQTTNGDQKDKKLEDESGVVSPTSTFSTALTLRPIPDPPPAPQPLDLSHVQDPDTRKLLEKEHSRAVKSYERALKDREKAIREREKLEEKRERKAQREAEKATRDAHKAKEQAERDAKRAKRKVEQVAEMTQGQKEELRLKQERQRMEAEARRLKGEVTPSDEVEKPPQHEELKKLPQPGKLEKPSQQEKPTPPPSSPSPPPTTNAAPESERPQPQPKPQKDRKFCTLPPKDAAGERDATWVRVFMENVDEVGAHCGLFFVDERYERLVGEVSERVERWVREEEDARLVRSVSGGHRG